jgi:hypothetical protein
MKNLQVSPTTEAVYSSETLIITRLRGVVKSQDDIMNLHRRGNLKSDMCQRETGNLSGQLIKLQTGIKSADAIIVFTLSESPTSILKYKVCKFPYYGSSIFLWNADYCTGS